MNRLWSVSFPYWEFVVRAVVVYCFVLFLLRLGGKRQVGQMGVGEFVAILLISNAVQNAMNGGDNSITGGLILAAVLIGLSIAVEYLTYKSKKAEVIIQGRPTLLVHRGHIIRRNLDKERLSVRELRVLLRKQGVHDLDDVEEAVLESNGFVSVTRKSEASTSRQ
ncbi:MAG: DUF421 domain-containing protein [Armatimonadota bacterium]|nr:DUF421 domain-containing protein [Armatimonadota bacterium]